MTNDEIIEMAKQSGLINKDYDASFLNKFTYAVENFAKLVAQHELQACVKAIEDQIAWDFDDPESTAIKAIRTKGQS
jgi:hypothetical protein